MVEFLLIPFFWLTPFQFLFHFYVLNLYQNMSSLTFLNQYIPIRFLVDKHDVNSLVMAVWYSHSVCFWLLAKFNCASYRSILIIEIPCTHFLHDLLWEVKLCEQGANRHYLLLLILELSRLDLWLEVLDWLERGLEIRELSWLWNISWCIQMIRLVLEPSIVLLLIMTSPTIH